MTENYHKWYSQYISRDFEMLVFGHSGIPVILFPPAKGRYYTIKDNMLIHSVEKLLNEGLIRIYCPDSMDSENWYNYSISPGERVAGYMAYEKLIIHDVIGFALFESQNSRVALAGCGFGGFHAANILFKYPYKVSSLITLSGIYNIKRFIMGHYDDNCYFNNPPDYLPGLNDEYYLDGIRDTEIVLKAQQNTESAGENRFISNILITKEVEHSIDLVNDNKDEWSFWKNSLQDALSTLLK